MINLLWHSDDLKLGWNLGNVTNVWTSISERNLYFRTSYLIRTSLEPARTMLSESARTLMIQMFNLEELWSIYYGICEELYTWFAHIAFNLEDDLKLGWNLGNMTNVWTSISERNLYFLYLIRTSLETARTCFQNVQELWW